MLKRIVLKRSLWLTLLTPVAVACVSATDSSTLIAKAEQGLRGIALAAPLRVFGQPDMKQTSYNEVVNNRTFYPAGVLVDRDPGTANSHVYVFDSGNSRILGFDTIGTCTGGTKVGQACTEDSFCSGGSCAVNSTKAATFAIGQPSTSGAGACNGDNTTRAAASASTLCLVPYPAQVSPLEGPRGGQLARDASRNLYVVDTFNNRVVRYNNPFATGGDTIADWQFGQTGMTGRLCNQGAITQPTAQSLCTGAIDEISYENFFTSAVDVSPDGTQVWIADPGNHRVLKVKPGTADAQLVLGQSNFTSAVEGCTSPTNTSLCLPTGVAYDSASNTLYVLDGNYSGGGRVLVFKNPAANGQTATSIWNVPSTTSFKWPRGLTLEPSTGALWVSDTDNQRVLRFVNGVVTHVLGDNDLVSNGSCGEPDQTDTAICSPHGSIGIDRDGKFFVPDTNTSRVKRFPNAAPLDGTFAHATYSMFDQPGRNGTGYANHVGASGLANPGFVAFVGSQMVVADRWRIVFWNNYTSTTNFAGGSASGVLAQTDLFSQETNTINNGGNFSSLSYDATKKLLYATVNYTRGANTAVSVWNVATGGLTSGQAVAQTFTSADLKTTDGAALVCNTGCQFTHLTVDAANDIGWLVDSGSHRVLRITSLSSATNRRVDLVLGQSSLTSNVCNRGQGVHVVAANGFCDPAEVMLDPTGNVFVVDGTWECRDGNCRVVEYQKSDIPAPNGTLRFPTANPVRVFGQSDLTTNSCDPTTGRLCSPRFIAFDPRDGAMIASGDAYHNPLNKRLAVWTNPTKSGTTAPIPTTIYSTLPINQAGSIAIDANGYMAVHDHTWNRITLFQVPVCNPATDDCGSSGTGGSGGSSSTGGTTSKGGSSSNGGTTSKGGSSSTGGATSSSKPCSGLCSSPITFTAASYNSGNLGSNATCHETTAAVTSGNCGNMGTRTFTVNGTTMSCNFQNWASMPAKRNGGYCFQATAGTPTYAYFSTF